ncbi:MAG: hypothetical protein ACFFE4_20775 [Candidatus Thorarchaeota archaeon]
MKKKARIVILMIAVITGFTCAFSTVLVHAKSSKLDFEAIEYQIYFVPLDEWVEDGVYHLRFYKQNDISGTIGGIPFSGYNEVNFHIKSDLMTGELTGHGMGTMYLSWNGLEGTFYGTIVIKGTNEGFEGKVILQGAGDFEGMKLFCKVWNIAPPFPPTNQLSGTILVPR